ncbi:hypothetical protein HA402_000510 [Bradysia odoriphaga]|nr:hypothetical protein HA402_000510 [Bradysia odoriphaga]
MKKLPPKQSNYKTVLNAIDIGLVQNAKGCLDGCTIWLCGFDASDTDKLKKIINIGGGTRIDEHGPDVEYVIVGKPNTAELTYLKSLDESNVVTMNWLAACINAKRCADPTEFIYKLQASISDSVQTVPSPASRKNIEDMSPYERFRYMSRMLNVNDDDEVIKKRNEKTLLDQYSLPAIVKEVNVQREETNVCSETDEESDQIDPNLFRGVIFALFAFSEESTQELLTEIEEAGGKTVDVNDFSKTVDYLIVPSDSYDIGECGYKAKEIVTELWIHECLDGNALVDIKYYHRAIIIEENCKPLSGLTIVLSTFTTPERDFLHSLAQVLGGVVNDRYIRRQNPILVCPTPLGKKYFGAVKWNLPVVTCEWLRECLKQRAKVPMEKYVLVDPRRAEKENSSDNDGSEQTQKFENPNVEVPKRPSSMPFVEYFKRVWRTYLGDDNPDTPSPVESTKKKPKKNHEDNATAGQEKPSGDGATQVINFIREVEDIKNRPSTQQMLTHDLPTNEEENPKEHHEQHNDEQMKRFSLGATTFDDELQQKIETLGGTVCEESSAFDPSCTHLICLELNSSEKTFSVIASGRWLLCPAYIEESFAAGRFLNEEEYEWGNPKAASKLPNEINEKTNNIARMNYKWRMELKLRSEKENRKVGIFSGIRAILHTNRKDSFKRLIEAGCGVVVDLKQPYTKQKDFQGITHCFVDRRMGQMSSAEKDALKAAGVHIVTMLYIQACVDQDVMPNVKDFAVR